MVTSGGNTTGGVAEPAILTNIVTETPMASSTVKLPAPSIMYLEGPPNKTSGPVTMPVLPVTVQGEETVLTMSKVSPTAPVKVVPAVMFEQSTSNDAGVAAAAFAAGATKRLPINRAIENRTTLV
jgi:hypothetical protein